MTRCVRLGDAADAIPAKAGAPSEAIFTEATLPPGVKRAFANVCPGAPSGWRTVMTPAEEAEAAEAAEAAAAAAAGGSGDVLE